MQRCGPVVPIHRAAMLVCGLVLVHLPLRAAVLIHEYALRGSLQDNLGGESLTALSGQITALGYVFAANQGLSIATRDFTPASYSIELSFKLDVVGGPTKLLDFHNLTADPGLYQQDGRLAFTPAASSSALDFTADTDVHLVLTRDSANNLVTAYVNGQQRFAFYDDGALAAPPGLSNRLSFFVNDSNELNASGGTANYLRIFEGALTGGEVSTLFAAGPPVLVPEPSTLALLAVGSLAVAVASGRRRNRR